MASREERSRSFGTVAVTYDDARTGPPDEAAAWLLPAGAVTVLDLGAGTGKLSRALAGQGVTVTAVEPDPRMRAVLAERSPGVRVLAGTGEDIPLPDASMDGVFVSSAWHWMDPDRTIPEVARVLRDGGRFGILGSGMDRETGWLREVRWRPGQPDSDGTEPPRRRKGGDRERPSWRSGREFGVELPPGSPFGHEARTDFRFTRAMTAEEIVAMLGTYSRLITAPAAERDATLAAARADLATRFPDGGPVDVPMRTRCWRADRATRGAG